MLVVTPVALALLAQAAASASAAQNADTHTPKAPATSSPAATSGRECSPTVPNSDQIVICAERPQGYRLNPDVMEAKRELKHGGRPPRPYGGTLPPDCQTVGPVPCMNAGINLIGAALTAAEMAQRLAKGQEVGSMFVTDPHPTEYQLYVEAKKRREEAEAEKAALAKAKAAAAKTQAAPPPPAPQVSPPPQ